jgi:hypothetical protein
VLQTSPIHFIPCVIMWTHKEEERRRRWVYKTPSGFALHSWDVYYFRGRRANMEHRGNMWHQSSQSQSTAGLGLCSPNFQLCHLGMIDVSMMAPLFPPLSSESGAWRVDEKEQGGGQWGSTLHPVCTLNTRSSSRRRKGVGSGSSSHLHRPVPAGTYANLHRPGCPHVLPQTSSAQTRYNP